jgi:hypothetical protein
MSDSIKMPEADQFGFVKTFNNTGYMTTYLDEFSEAWVRAVQSSAGKNADIGAAYGVATLRALAGTRGTVLAVDLDPGHLEVLREAASKDGLENHLETQAADFPNGISVADNSLNNILICRVLHFFDGTKLQESINWCARKLAPGGAIYLVNETPYLRNFQNFIPIYEERRSKGFKFPGFIDDVKSIAPERAPFLPPQMHLLDADVLSRVCVEAGLTVERTAFIPRPNFPIDIQLDGRESVGVIARKPR